MKRSAAISIIFISVLTFSCGDKKPARDAPAEVKKGAAPVADREFAVIEMENFAAFGTITIELYSNIAPKMVERFKTLAKQGFYDGTTFHRVSGMVLQGGDPFSKDNDPGNDGTGTSAEPDLPAEFSDLPFERGTLGAARAGSEVNSANCQFFITMRRTPQWDKHYTVFGKVIVGMNNADAIAGVPRNGEMPLDAIRIRSINIMAEISDFGPISPSPDGGQSR